NKYVMQDEKPINYLRIDEQVEAEQIERTGRFKAARDMSRVERRLKQLADACRNGGNVMPVLVDTVKDYASLGEISDVYRQWLGPTRERIIFGGRGKGNSQARRDPDHEDDEQEEQAEGQGSDVRHRLHRPHVRRQLPGREGLVRSARRAVRTVPARSGHRRAA